MSRQERTIEYPNDDSKYIVRFPYDEEINDLLREVRGRYDPDERGWLIRVTPESVKLMEMLERDYDFEEA